MTHFVQIDEVYVMHEAILKASGGKGGVRDFALLHSAVERPKATFGGIDLYPTLWTKAASILQSLCLNHAFTDGNKRTAWAATKRFLWLNGYHLHAEVKDAADFIVFVDNEKPELKYIASWLTRHSRKVTRQKFILHASED